MSKNLHKNIANYNHEDDGRRSSRDWSGHISKRAQRAARVINRRATRKAARDDLREQLES